MKKTLTFILTLIMVFEIFTLVPTTAKAASVSEPKITSVTSIPKGIQLSWKEIKNADNYVIYRRSYNPSTKKWSSWVKIKSNYVGTNFIDTTVTLSTYYRYAVRAASGKTLSTYTSTSNIKYNIIPNVAISNASAGISVKWEKIASATGYTVYSSTYNAKTKKWSGWTNRGTTKATTSSWTDKKVANGSIYRYTVRAVYNGGKTGFKATSGLRFLTQPTVSVSNVSNGVKISWIKNSSATSYAVYKGTLTNGTWSNWALLGTTKNNVFSFTDKKAVSGITYRYTVRSINGNSKSSFKAKGIMFLSQPTVTVSSSKDGIKINWTPSKGAINYALYRSEFVEGEWTSWFRITTVPFISYVDSNSVKGTKYKYTVKALNGSYASAYKASSVIKGAATPVNSDSTTNLDYDTVRPDHDAIIADPFAFYSKAANDIHINGSAGYKKISWQALEDGLTVNTSSSISSIITNLFSSFLTKREDAETKDNPKGTDDAKNRMPSSNCDKKYIKSATAKKDGDNYVITIVLNEFVNPSYEDADGLPLMSRDFLDMKDVIDTVATDNAVSSVVKNIDGTITYTDYTIVATMTADGKFISIVHYGVGKINTDMQTFAGPLTATGTLSLNAEYYDFYY